MNVYLIKTPKYPIADYETVLALLRSFSGPIKFISPADGLTSDQILLRDEALNPYNYLGLQKRQYILENESEFPLSWQELFDYCMNFRKHQQVLKYDFVILLTNKRNEHNWFSMFDSQNNAFVDCLDWEYYTDAAHQYPIAYEVIANIFRSIMRPERKLPSPFFHEVAKGCMNDGCMQKSEISLKLRTGDICPICIKELIAKGIDERVLEQGLSIFEGIRKQLLFKAGARGLASPGIIELTDNNKIYFRGIGNLELTLFPLDKSLYIFYLNHLDGVRLNELTEHHQELLGLYRRFSVADTNDTINARVADLINPLGGSFSQKKSRINRAIFNLLGERLATFYQIGGLAGEPFMINIPPSLIVLPDDRTR